MQKNYRISILLLSLTLFNPAKVCSSADRIDEISSILADVKKYIERPSSFTEIELALLEKNLESAKLYKKYQNYIKPIGEREDREWYHHLADQIPLSVTCTVSCVAYAISEESLAEFARPILAGGLITPVAIRVSDMSSNFLSQKIGWLDEEVARAVITPILLSACAYTAYSLSGFIGLPLFAATTIIGTSRIVTPVYEYLSGKPARVRLNKLKRMHNILELEKYSIAEQSSE